MKKLKMAVDDLTRQNGDLNGLKARLTQENFELQVRNTTVVSVMNYRSCNQMGEWKGLIHDFVHKRLSNYSSCTEINQNYILV